MRMDLLPFQPVSATFFSLASPFPFLLRCFTSCGADLFPLRNIALSFSPRNKPDPEVVFSLRFGYFLLLSDICFMVAASVLLFDIGAILKPIGGFVSRDARQTDTLF